MKKTGAWLVRYALEQLGISHTFGIPGVHNTEIYDELNKSATIQPMLVTHEGCGAFMADAVSRTSDTVGAMLIVPAAGATHAASGIGEAFLDGIPMLVLSGGVRSDSDFEYQLHDMDQHAMLAPITKATFKVAHQKDIIRTLYKAYEIATSGEPGPVFVEIPVNIQLYTAEVERQITYAEFLSEKALVESGHFEQQLDEAVDILIKANKPGLFLGWGAVDVSDVATQVASLLGAPASTTLQGLSSFPANDPMHTGMSFGAAAVPAATKAFEDCDALLAVGTRFGEIGTGSFGVTVPESLIHIDINPKVLNTNYPAKVAIQGDANEVLPALLRKLKAKIHENNICFDARYKEVSQLISEQKASYKQEWYKHDSGSRVNPALFFDALRKRLPDDGYVVVDDGNHTFLTAELMPIHTARTMISPTDFNCMGYAVPATIGTKLLNPEKDVVSIIGDGAFLMTCMEITTASKNGLGAIFTIFNDGELSQISQAQEVPYNRKTCSVLADTRMQGVAMATGAAYVRIDENSDIDEMLDEAWRISKAGQPVVLDVNIDYSKQTRFTKGIVGTNLKRLPLNMKVRMISRALVRKVTC
ncbi:MULTISPECIES: thiamine pyrophosphate-binding protein [unclassified Oleiphilus]|jgi:acetolactate synthase-1/2/3 large subunit|nr:MULTISPECIES: thiamine pyrophosphate-binding protein [unclassified Oleiphilus]KZY77653.1 acetolactate synthase large subunit [Oleiphilus sp. HI0068]KZY85624.1 acetolactate synthase large subunit [Oleiphilus sp. HI0069]KZY89526.1 acetolactate synthase large subunit [Oleiphilus sp. HI0072]KZZ08214.1 acetolactate synthase large subunit [Oleiphilus sp. HI0078]KZZ30520.1 acetolactate synthase large subunit [Oleiphilus sp. HI0085]